MSASAFSTVVILRENPIVPFARPRFPRLKAWSISRFRTQLEHRIYETTPPRPIRTVAGALSWRLRRIARPTPVFVVEERLADGQGGVKGEHEIVVYFAEGKTRLYQLQQWLPVFEQLAQHHVVLVVTRREESWRYVVENTSLGVALVPTFRDLYELYDRVAAKVVLYVNNGGQNFQSLSATRMLHVHINHGESDKLSMVSNQAKAYDRVFVAGEAAILRHRAALLEMDETKLIKVGRPQLDLELAPALPPSERKTILYAPTWEGENEANNYTSLDLYGTAIAAAALGTPGARFVYKPHPRVTTSKLPEILNAHDSICRLITDGIRRDPAAGHRIEGDSTNVLTLLKQADLLISDVSSVTLDFLYLRNERPLLLTDRRSDRELLRTDAPVSVACDIVDASSVGSLPVLLEAALVEDSYSADRQRMRQLYFGDLQHGESTGRFIEEIDTLVRLRDEGLRQRGTLTARGPRGFEGPADDSDLSGAQGNRDELNVDDELSVEESV
jgi:hypothetical protein